MATAVFGNSHGHATIALFFSPPVRLAFCRKSKFGE
jgi:hypothetical protein